MVTITSELTNYLRTLPSEQELEIREAHGELVMKGTRHEAEVLCQHGYVEGIASDRGKFKYLRLTVGRRVAITLLRRKLCDTGRVVSTTSRLVRKMTRPGRGVYYEHIVRRTNGYAPSEREAFLKSVGCGLALRP